mmetsp:Transcript_29172/g.61937  ORF Transcript_29172/g.61937 Transcript_29172/m.61937 type:complete len:691 (+) Transcript_29172:146-2218(+)
MVYGVARGPPVDESDLAAFIETLSALPVEEWQKRIAALKKLVDSTPDYSTTPAPEDGEVANGGAPAAATPNGNKNQTIPWYRSSKSVRRLTNPLKTVLLDARSAVVKEATELIGTLLMVKLQPHPSLIMGEGLKKEDGGKINGGLETINGGFNAPKQQPPPPAFVGRLLLKDLLPAILDMSKQTVKVIRTYGVNMTLDILPHCRVKSCIVVLLERMKTHQNRTLREDCARYLRCVLETWPWDPTGSCDNISNDNIGIVNSRKEERLTLDSTRQIGLGLGRTLSDSAKPVREEAKRGFQALFRRFRPLWDEVMSSGVVRDLRLRKKLLEVASRSDSGGNLFDDTTSLGELSLNSAVSGLSYASHRSGVSHRSYASRGMTPTSRGMANNGVPSVIGTPKTSPRLSLSRRTPGSSSARGSERAKIQAKESYNKSSINQYVTSSGHVLSTPSPRSGRYSKPTFLCRGEEAGATITQQPFASLLETPSRSMIRQSPDSRQKSCKVLRKSLSRRISGIIDDIPQPDTPGHRRQLSSINETEDGNNAPHSAIKDAHSTEITNVALEVIAAHLSHLDQIENLILKEKGLLLHLNEKLGISITDETKTAELANHLASLSEEQVCDYFESVHMCVEKQRYAGEILLKEMERISQGDVSTLAGSDSNDHSLEAQQMHEDLAQSPLGHRDLRDEFGAATQRV